MYKILMIEGDGLLRYPLQDALSGHSQFQLTTVVKNLQRGYEMIKRQPYELVVIDSTHMKDEIYAKKLLSEKPVMTIGLHHHMKEEEIMSKQQRLGLHHIVQYKEENLGNTVKDLLQVMEQYHRMKQQIERHYSKKVTASYAKKDDPIIAIGASTGGVGAIEEILLNLKGDLSPILLVQHMSKTFTHKMAHRLSLTTHLVVKEAEDGEKVKRNMVYLAPGDLHMQIEKQGEGYVIRLNTESMEHFQRPAVDQLFRSMAREVGPLGIGVLLTGMGRDGAKGLLDMKEAGAYTLAQDAKSCVVFGMPKAAIEIGGVCEVVNLSEMAKRIIEINASSKKALAMTQVIS